MRHIFHAPPMRELIHFAEAVVTTVAIGGVSLSILYWVVTR